MKTLLSTLLLLALCWPSSSQAADPTLTNSAEGTASTSSVNASFGFTATAGRLLVLTVGADDYNSGNPSGWTASTGFEQETNLGAYVWWKVADGSETSVTYTIGSASGSAWTVTEYDNIDPAPYDVSAGQLAGSSGSSYTTPSITPSTGRRLLLAIIGGSHGTQDFTSIDTWTNSFIETRDSWQSTGGARTAIGIAMLVVDGDGSTSFSSGATYTVGVFNAQTRTGQIFSFKVATSGGGPTCTGGLLLRGVGGC